MVFEMFAGKDGFSGHRGGQLNFRHESGGGKCWHVGQVYQGVYTNYNI